MTLLASERSLLIRSKFRSVLQLRIQNRRQNEINADSGLKTTCPSVKAEREQSEALRLTDDGATQKSPPCGVKTETAQATDRSVCAAQRQKKARQTEHPSAKLQRRPGSLEPSAHKHTPAPDNCPVSFPLSSDVFEDDISSCSSSSSSAEHHHHGLLHQSPAFSCSPGLPGDQLLSDMSPAGPPLNHHSPSHAQSALVLLPATEGTGHQPMSMTLGEATSTATTGRAGGMYVTSSPATPLLPKTARPTSPSASTTLTPSLGSSTRLPRPRKPRETKPKMRKLKYHQYIPPDQRVGTGAAVGGASKKSPTPAQPIDPAYSHLLQKQQVFLQLQILQNQQQQQYQQQPTQQQQQPANAVPSGEANQMVRFSGATPQNPQPVAARTSHTPADESTAPKPELLPANLVDLTVSELRQQLRKRGLPVSGTKPALLQRLRPFQLPHTCLTPTPLCQLEPHPSAAPIPAPTPAPSLLPPPPGHSPPGSSGASSSGPDSPVSSPSQRVYIQPNGGIPNGVLNGGIPDGYRMLTGFPSSAVSVTVAPGEQCGLTNAAVFLAPPAGTPSGTPSPSLPLSSSSSPCSSSSPLQHCGGAPWRTEQEQQMELSLEEAMRERRRNRTRDRSFSTATESCVGGLHPFLQQDPGRVRVKTEPVDEQTEVLFTQVFCCQPCDPIGQDFELPVQITASPVQTPPTPSVRSLEEELQEAIQKAQMGPSQSLEDILDDWMPITSDDPAHIINDAPQQQQSDQSLPSSHQQSDQSLPSSQQQQQQQQPPGNGGGGTNKDDNFLSSPLCSSILLEMPPSPVVTTPSASLPPPPPPLCASPLSSPPLSSSSSAARGGRKRRAAVAFFDPAEWLETLSCGLRPLSPAPARAPFQSDLESDLNVNRVLDMLIEQW